ncbi:MAG: hypothetical protein PHX68_01770 [Alphaproteobacteria bacterium]|nr:hypothetical protein [Alphaproteobacteria bacterium]
MRCPVGEVGWVLNNSLRFRDGQTRTYTANTTITLPSGQQITAGGYGHCIACDELDISALAYQRQCASCGGTWTGSSCTPP